MTDFRAELQALVAAHDAHEGGWPEHHVDALFAAVERARAALAQQEPQPVADGEVASDWFAVAMVAQDMRSRGLAEQMAGDELLKLANRNRAALAQQEPEELTDEELLRTYGLAKRDHNYEGPIDDWPKRAERAATVAGLRAAIAADRARWGRPAPQPAEALAALAQQEPEGLTEVSLPPGYIDPEHTGDDRQILETFYSGCLSEGGTSDEVHLRGLRAVLTRWGRPAPQPVAEGEVGELAAELRGLADYFEGECYSIDWVNQLRRSADLLERQHPQPIPVSERPPGPEDCDAEGRCWWFCFECPGEHSYWIFANEVYCVPRLWLPAHALPLPTHTSEND